MRPYDVSYSRTYPVTVEHAFDTLLPVPLPEIFSARCAAIAAITALEDQDGVWGTVGQTRTVVMGDGGRMVETLTSVERPASFGYTIEPTRGPMRPLVHHAEGRWSFEPAGTGCRITWSWSLVAQNPATARLLPVLGRNWRAYARRSFERIETLLLPVRA